MVPISIRSNLNLPESPDGIWHRRKKIEEKKQQPTQPLSIGWYFKNLYLCAVLLQLFYTGPQFLGIAKIWFLGKGDKMNLMIFGTFPEQIEITQSRPASGWIRDFMRHDKYSHGE
jgi:hypothetical protein